MEKEKPLVTLARGLSDLGGVLAAGLVPEDARRHFRASVREAMLGGRSLLDRAIRELEAERDPSGLAGRAAQRARAETIPVED